MDKKGGRFGLPVAFDNPAGRINDEQVADPQLGPVQTLGVEQKTVSGPGHGQTEMIADALAQSQPVCPA